jgi:hypothetical protein
VLQSKTGVQPENTGRGSGDAFPVFSCSAKTAALAFFVALGNNLVTGMRPLFLFTILFTIALWLSFPTAAFPQQGTADSAKAGGDSPNQSAPSESPPSPAPESNPSGSPRSESNPAAAAPAENSQAQTPADTAPAPEQKTSESVVKKQTAARKKHHKRTPAPSGTPLKVVVREGGAREPAEQIVPGMTPAEAVRQRQDAEQWLNSTDGQLKQLAQRNLNPEQQETVGQIRNYMDGARGALREGDLRRASTLAEKAHLLSEDMVTH